MAEIQEVNERYLWWDQHGHLNIALVVGDRDHLVHHRFPDQGGRGHQLDHDCHCDPQLIEATDRFEVWRHTHVPPAGDVQEGRDA